MSLAQCVNCAVRENLGDATTLPSALHRERRNLISRLPMSKQRAGSVRGSVGVLRKSDWKDTISRPPPGQYLCVWRQNCHTYVESARPIGKAIAVMRRCRRASASGHLGAYRQLSAHATQAVWWCAHLERIESVGANARASPAIVRCIDFHSLARLHHHGQSRSMPHVRHQHIVSGFYNKRLDHRPRSPARDLLLW